jgi:predicted alpha/beta superfamily hydrolase
METKQPVVMENTARVEFRSAVNHRSYSITVGLPLIAFPEKGCPVLYVLDGNWYFGSAVEAVRVYAPGAVVVGIGYPNDQPYIERVLERHEHIPAYIKDQPAFRTVTYLERFYDLSLPASDEVLAGDLDASIQIRAKDVGGLDSFLEVIETEIKPRVAALAPIDSSSQAIFGHSLGGLAVLHALFVAPDAFRTFIAASPSIWWNGKAVLGGESKFAAAVRAGTATPRVLITMGSEEQTPDPNYAARFGLDSEQQAAQIRRHRMVDNARELTERLKALRGSGAFEVEEYSVFPRQHHNIAAWSALARGVSFAFPR